MSRHKSVFVYWNIHKGQWSIKDITPGSPTYGRVIARRGRVLLGGNVQGKVSEAGRQRVLREGRKNVHAGLTGILWGDTVGDIVQSFGDTITYNPRKYTSFVHTVDESPFEGSAYALLTPDRRVFVA